MITSVEISGVKRIQNARIDIERGVTLLLGGNGSGKSSVLEAVHMATAAAEAAASFPGHQWTDDGKIIVDLPAKKLASTRGDVRTAIRGTSATVRFEDGSHSCEVLLQPAGEVVRISISGRIVAERLVGAERPFCAFVPGLAGIPSRETVLSPGVLRRRVAGGDSNLVLRNILLVLKQNQLAWTTFIEDLRHLIPGADFEIECNVAVDEDVHVNFRHDEAEWLALEHAGTGFLQAIHLLAYVRRFDPQVILLDEPDAHLHPRNQAILCQLIQKVCREDEGNRTQVLVATHSRHVISALRASASTKWFRSGAPLPAVEGDVVSGLMELGAFDDGEQFAGKTIRCVVLTEDNNKSVLVPILESSGFALAETAILSYEGADSHLTVGSLRTFFADRFPGVHILVHRDRDYLDESAVTKFKQRTQTGGVVAFVTPGTDLEALYLSPEYLAEHSVPAELLAAATDLAKPDSLRKMINSRHAMALERRKKNPAEQCGAGVIAEQCHAEYAASPATLRHGKSVLKRLRDLMTEAKINPRVFMRESRALEVAELRAFASRVWPSAHVPNPPNVGAATSQCADGGSAAGAVESAGAASAPDQTPASTAEGNAPPPPPAMALPDIGKP